MKTPVTLTPIQRDELFAKWFLKQESVKNLAKEYNISESTAGNIIDARWPHRKAIAERYARKFCNPKNPSILKILI